MSTEKLLCVNEKNRGSGLLQDPANVLPSVDWREQKKPSIEEERNERESLHQNESVVV